MMTNDQSRVVRLHMLSGAAALLIASVFAVTADAKDVAVKVAELSERHGSALVRGLDFSPDGTSLAVDAEGPAIEIWDWEKRRVEKTLPKPEYGNDYGVTNPIFFSPDGHLLANCLQESRRTAAVRIWEIATGTVAKDITPISGTPSSGTCTGIAFSPDAKQLIRTSDTGGKPGNNVIAFEAATFEPLWGIEIDPYLEPKAIAVSPDGSTMAISGIRTYLKDGETTIEKNIYFVNASQQKVSTVISTEAMGPLAWSADGKQVAVAGEQFVAIIEAQTGVRLFQEKREGSAHMNVRLTADGRYFIDSDMNGRGTGLGVKIWDSSHKTLLQEIHGNVSAIAVSRDSKYLALGEAGRTTIWQFK